MAGGAAARTGGSDKEAEELGNRHIGVEEIAPAGTTYVDASVLINAKADEYVAVFGLIQEGATPAECSQKLNATLATFTDALNKLGVPSEDMYVDFIMQDRIYEFDINDRVAKERLAGFELKKNVSVHYRDPELFDKVVTAAAASQIFDLVKVDYVVRDTLAVRAQLLRAAANVIKSKAANLQGSLGMHLAGPTQVIAERYKTYFPTEMYGSYVAAEGEEAMVGYDRAAIIDRVRKAKTLYFNPLDASLFDVVFNPVVMEPVVQFTVYLKVKYDVGSTPAHVASAVSPKVRHRRKR